MVLVRNVFCCCSLRSGNLALGLFAATAYLTSIIWLLLIYHEFLVLEASQYIAICVMVLSSVQLVNCVLLMIGILLKLNCLIIPWLFGQHVVIAASLVGPVILMGLGTITAIPITVVTIVILNIYQLYHLACVYSTYKENNQTGERDQSEYEALE